MLTETTEPDTQLDWTDQIRTIARFISDRNLPVITITAGPVPRPDAHDCHVEIHVYGPTWNPHWADVLLTDSHLIDAHRHVRGAHVFNHVTARIAGVRVHLVYLTNVVTAVAS